MKKNIMLFLILSLSVFSQAQGQDCDRACLEEHLDNYLQAVFDNSPEDAGLFIGFRQTENAIVIPEGDGIWRTVTGFGPLTRTYYDPENDTAGYYGILEEGDGLAVGSLRLKIANNEITEAEWFLAREDDDSIDGADGNVPYDIDILLSTPPSERVVPTEERLSREALIAIANTYFDGITNSNAYIVKGNPGCTRFENGRPTTGQPLDEGMLGHEEKWDCRTQADFGVTLVANRRYFLADVEKQVVMVQGTFIRDQASPRRRLSFIEMFHIDDAKISSVYAAMFYPPADQPTPNWPPYNGTFPLPSSF